MPELAVSPVQEAPAPWEHGSARQAAAPASGALLITTGRWFNKLKPSGKTAKAPAYKQGFTYDEFAYGEDKPEQFTPAGSPLQDSIICAPSARVLAIDVDYPEALGASRLGHALADARERAVSRRGDHFHVLLDMRAVPLASWPQQGRTPWGDIKAAGFIPMPGSRHWTGAAYEPAADGWPSAQLPRAQYLAAATAIVSRLAVTATPELITALGIDRLAHAQDRLVQARQRTDNPRAVGTWIAPADVAAGRSEKTWVYASGYVQGSWAQLPDGFLAHDDELKDLAWDMGLRGEGRDAVLSEWHRLARADDPGDPWTDRDFERHWRKIPEIRAEIERNLEREAAEWDALDPDRTLRAAAEDRYRRRLDAQEPVNNPRDFDEGFTPATDFLPPVPVFARDASPGERRAHNDAFLGWGAFDPAGTSDSEHAWAVLERTFPIARYDPHADTWITRDLDRWVLRSGSLMRGLATDVIDSPAPGHPARMARGMTKDQALANEHGYPDEVVRAERRRNENWVKFHSAKGITAIAAYGDALLRSGKKHYCHVSVQDLDAEAAELWAGGECWDLRASADGPVRKAAPACKGIHLKSAACAPRHVPADEEAARLPLWTELTSAIWPDPEIREWALLCLSAGLTGDPAKVIPVLQGGTDRGKSTIAKALLSVLDSYGNVVNPKIIDGEANTHDTIFMELMGCRFAYIDEGPKAGRAATNRLKRLAGGAQITANRMRKDPVTFNPTHTLCIALNPEERLPLDDPAVVSRVRFLPCDGDPQAVIAAARKLDHFRSLQWRREMPGVLAVLMRRAAITLTDPSALGKDRAPDAVAKAERAEINDQDDVLRWFSEATTECPAGYPSRELYMAFRKWTEETKGMKGFVISEKKWALRMNELVPEDDGKTMLRSSKTRLRRRQPAPESWHLTGSVGDRPPAPPQPPPPGGAPPAPPAPAEFMAGRVTLPSPPPEPAPQLPVIAPEPDCPVPELPVTAPARKPRAKAARVPLTEEEKTARAAAREQDRQARAAARKEESARQREEGRQRKIAELGGPLVPLPAIVARDMTIMPCSPEQARAFLGPWLGRLAVDVETTGYPIGHENYGLRLVQLGGEGGAVVFDPASEASAAVIRESLAAARELHAHNAGADLIPLEHAGLCGRDAWDRMTDTVILAKLTDPKLTDSDEAGLKPLARNMMGDDYALSWRCNLARAELFTAGGWLAETEVTTPLDRSGWAQVPFCEAFVRYAASDVMDCAAVARLLAPSLPAWLIERERKFAKAWVPVGLHGTPLDAPHVTSLIEVHARDQEAARLRVEQATGGAVRNPKSAVEVPGYLASHGYALPLSLKTGKPGAAKGALEPFAALGDTLCADILEYRRHDTALGLLLRPWNEMCEHGDGRIRTSIMSIEARTGRTSSRNHNMQQVSRQGGMRACTTTEVTQQMVDWGLAPASALTCGISADFASVEVRVGAALSGDEHMQYLIAMGDLHPDRKKEFDLHWRTAITCYGELATKENRYNSKRINFAKMFGSGKASAAEQVGLPLHEVTLAFDAFSAVAPQYEDWDAQMRAFVHDGGQCYPAYSGRRLWMDTRAEHGAGNTAIQGTARELAVDATLRWLDGPWGDATLLIVHDELIAFNIPAAEAPAATEFLVKCMETTLVRAEGRLVSTGDLREGGVQIRAEASEPWQAWPDAS